jgi:hypothetical protein
LFKQFGPVSKGSLIFIAELLGIVKKGLNLLNNFLDKIYTINGHKLSFLIK